MLKKFARALIPPAQWAVLRRLRARGTDAWRLRALRRFPKRIVHHTYAGVPLHVTVGDPTAVEWYDRDWPDHPELDILSDRCDHGARVFNLGAHQCVMALVFAKKLRAGSVVVALEAMLANALAAQANRELNSCLGLQVVHAAVGEKSGLLSFNRSSNGRVKRDSDDDIGTENVVSYSVDDLSRWYGRPDIVTIDVEGFEARVLAGANDTLRGETDWLVEVHRGCGLEMFGDTVRSVVDAFDPERFDLLMSPENPRHFVSLDLSSPICSERFHLLALARRANPSQGTHSGPR